MEQHFYADAFIKGMRRYAPKWIAFNGKPAASFVSRHLRHGRDVRYGRQAWTIGETPVFVLPSSSAANQSKKYLDGRPRRLDWYREFAALLD
jgi:G:T/U-mismatch repair DNA glycosylase